MSQLASFSQVSQLQQLTASSTALTLGQDFSSAVAMIGKHVTYAKADGTQATGVVDAVKSDTTGALLQIGSDSVHTGAIVKVQ
jgi:flagellar hook assembly protein FlgD